MIIGSVEISMDLNYVDPFSCTDSFHIVHNRVN